MLLRLLVVLLRLLVVRRQLLQPLRQSSVEINVLARRT